MVTERERLDDELGRLERRLSDLDEEFFRLQHKADEYRIGIRKEGDPRIAADLTALLDRTERQIFDNRRDHDKISSYADEVGLSLRAEVSFQESREIENETLGKTADEVTDDLLERRKLRRERKRKIDGL
ncbi:MAG: hypothetical protein ACK5QX_00990 [bacterium]